ncbi:alpha/beta hydrolase family protein [Stenotrophomonas sp. 9(2022)]|uniref:alpha/beta hydrolase n=1 Tax=Stenotrophomonas sp. 9(2022) TaxID=2950153 RepID=UPI002114A46D|nr:alpha/beta hydrolase family protein [Stenotrophomonas sp. 9(2022)]
MFAPLAAGLADAGHEVLAPDLPGYGLSTAPWSAIEYGAWKQALLALIEAEHQRRPRPIVLLGASIGGYLAYLVAAEPPWVRGLVATTLACTTRSRGAGRAGTPAMDARPAAHAPAPYPALSARYGISSRTSPPPCPAARPSTGRGALQLDRHGPPDADATVVLVHGAGG